MQELEFYWHVPHEVLCEALREPIQNRISYIRSSKPKGEVETRLRCMTPVLHPERLPVEWREADAKLMEAYAKGGEAYAKLEEAYAKRWEADAKLEEAYAKWLSQVEALHKKEHPDCPWDGKTIFPKGEVA